MEHFADEDLGDSGGGPGGLRGIGLAFGGFGGEATTVLREPLSRRTSPSRGFPVESRSAGNSISLTFCVILLAVFLLLFFQWMYDSQTAITHEGGFCGG